MKIIPAIDLIDGNCVRLFQGDYSRKTEHSTSPLDVALDFVKKGAKYLHLVDQDGAVSGKVINIKVVEKIIKNTNLKVELGGGIRDLESISKWLDIGVQRVILGSIAVKNTDIVRQAVDRYGASKIIVGIDARNGMVAIDGWKTITDIKAVDLSRELQNIGIKEIIYTDVSKDGAMEGVNIIELKEMIDTGANITASGGVSKLEDIKKVKEIGCVGVIIGKALYTGDIDLRDVILKMYNVMYK